MRLSGIFLLSIAITMLACLIPEAQGSLRKNKGRVKAANTVSQSSKERRRHKIQECCARQTCPKMLSTLASEANNMTSRTTSITSSKLAESTYDLKGTTDISEPVVEPVEVAVDSAAGQPTETEDLQQTSSGGVEGSSEEATTTSTSETSTASTTEGAINSQTSSTSAQDTVSTISSTLTSSTSIRTTTASISSPTTTASTRTSTTTVTSTSTTTLKTSTSTTTTTSTTTKAPTKEELVLGTCDTTFQLDPSVLASDKSLKEPEKYGFWVQSCGVQYLFGKSLVTWRENFINCYKIGMEPISFENSTKHECFKTLVSQWKYSSNFWTSGLRVSTSEFSWCTKNKTISIDKTAISWAPGQPENFNNSENCVHLNVSKENATYMFSDRICTDSQMLACQGPPTPAPACSSPACPNVTCEKNKAYFTLSGKSDYLTQQNTHGTWFTYNGRSYLFSYSNATQTFSGAIHACCAVGMTLLSLEFDYKYKSIIAALEANVSSEDFFWTSGSDKGCKTNYGYCTAKRLLRKEAIWASGQPDNADGNENSVAVFIDSKKAELHDVNEDKKFRYICEARDTTNAKTGGNAVRDECMSIYKVNQTEMDNLLNITSPDLRIKCFIKCLGENSGLMVNGKFLENEVLAILEKLAGGNLDDLKKNMGIMDECGSSTAGMDECDKAAQMMKCTKEKAPDVLTSVVIAMDQAIPVEPAPIQTGAFCYTNVTYAASRKAEYDNCVGNCTLPYAFVRTVCGKKYLQENVNPGTFYNAHLTCLTYGLRLASIESAEEVNCLAGIGTPYANSWTWVAGSRMNSSVPRWCTSSAPFNLGNFLIINDSSDPALDVYMVKLDVKEISAASKDSLRMTLCVP